MKFYQRLPPSIPSKVGLLIECMHGFSVYLKKQQNPNLLKLILPTTPDLALEHNLPLSCDSNLTDYTTVTQTYKQRAERDFPVLWGF